jgi:hypothetical protein
MLAFGGQEMIGDAQERIDGNGGTDFFQRFAYGALLQGFEKIEFAADNAPATGLGRATAEREEQAAGFVDQEDSHTYPWIIRAEQGDAPFVLN